MTWEYQSNPQRWTITHNKWSGVVERIPGKGYQWKPRIEHTTNTTLHFDGPIMDNPLSARTWCLSKIAELQILQNGKHGDRSV